MEKRQQVIAQCSAVTHMATCIAQVYADYGRMFNDGLAETLIDPVGQRTAWLMETLGNILNSMDAVTKDDGWMTPIFERAHKMWTT